MTTPGTIVDGYQLTRILGEGPFGIVWHAKDARRGTPAAVKLLRDDVARQSAGRAIFSRLLTAMKAYTELQHPNLVRVFRSLQQPEASALGLAMEYVDGQTLDRMQMSLVASRDARVVDRVRLARLVGWFEDFSRTLAWLHMRGVVHGNLKPTNVMVLPGSGKNTLKVLDLCWSAIGIPRPPKGTESFLSPEQLEGSAPTHASDQWTTALMLHRMMTAGVRDLSLSPANGVPSMLLQTLDRALKPSPAARFPDINHFADQLLAIRTSLEDEPTDRGAAVVPSEFVDEPATVRMSVVTHTSPTEGLPSMTPSISDALSTPPEPALGDVLDMSSEPALVIGALTLPPEGNFRSHSAVTTEESTRRFSPLAMFGAAFLVIAGGVVIATASWYKGRTQKIVDPPAVARASDPPLTGAQPHGDAVMKDESKPNETNAKPGEPNTKASEPKNTKAPPAEQKATATASAKTPAAVAQPSSPPEASSQGPAQDRTSGAQSKSGRTADESDDARDDRSSKKQKGAGSRGSRVLDDKADEAMQRLAALGDGAAPAAARADPKAAQAPAPDDARVADPKRLDVRCDEGDGDACLKLGEQAKSDEARALFERACTFGRGNGCLKAGELYEHGGSESTLPKARDMFERGCGLKSGDACHRAAEMWREGRGAGADSARADQFEQKACKLGRKPSCKSGRAATSSTAG